MSSASIIIESKPPRCVANQQPIPGEPFVLQNVSNCTTRRSASTSYMRRSSSETRENLWNRLNLEMLGVPRNQPLATLAAEKPKTILRREYPLFYTGASLTTLLTNLLITILSSFLILSHFDAVKKVAQLAAIRYGATSVMALTQTRPRSRITRNLQMKQSRTICRTLFFTIRPFWSNKFEIESEYLADKKWQKILLTCCIKAS